MYPRKSSMPTVWREALALLAAPPAGQAGWLAFWVGVCMCLLCWGAVLTTKPQSTSPPLFPAGVLCGQEGEAILP